MEEPPLTLKSQHLGSTILLAAGAPIFMESKIVRYPTKREEQLNDSGNRVCFWGGIAKLTNCHPRVLILSILYSWLKSKQG